MYDDLIEYLIYNDNWDLEKIEDTANGVEYPKVFFQLLYKVIHKQQRIVEDDWSRRDDLKFWRRLEIDVIRIQSRVNTLKEVSVAVNPKSLKYRARKLMELALVEENTSENCIKFRTEFEKLLTVPKTRSSYLCDFTSECEERKVNWRNTAMNFYNNPEFAKKRGRKKKTR